MLLLVASAALAADCRTVALHQAAWSGQPTPTEAELTTFCSLVTRSTASDAAQMLSCYADSSAYGASACASFRAADARLKRAPGCTDWARKMIAERGAGAQVTGQLLCIGAVQGSDDQATLRLGQLRCHGDATWAGSPACSAVLDADQAAMIVAKQSECLDEMGAIGIVEYAWDAQHDGFLALPKAPRSTPTPDPVAWTPTGDWEKAGMMPIAAARGVYWVDVAGATFTVHCQLDLDGDGALYEVAGMPPDDPKVRSAPGVK